MNGKFNEKYSPGYPAGKARESIFALSNTGILRVLIVLIFFCVTSSCFEKGDCLITNTTLVRVKLRSLKTKADTTFTFQSIISQEGKEIYKDQELSFLELPVSPTRTETSFYLIQASRKDTLSFSYRNETLVLSPDCGAYDYQKDLALQKNTMGLDSIRVLNNQLFRSVTANVEIYF